MNVRGTFLSDGDSAEAARPPVAPEELPAINGDGHGGGRTVVVVQGDEPDGALQPRPAELGELGPVCLPEGLVDASPSEDGLAVAVPADRAASEVARQEQLRRGACLASHRECDRRSSADCQLFAVNVHGPIPLSQPLP